MTIESLPLLPKILTGIVGLIIAVQSLSLFVGTHFISEGGKEWRTLSNEIFMVTDIIGGVLLLIFAVTDGRFPIFWGVVVLALLLLATHIYRIVEYFMDIEMPFCVSKLLHIIMIIRAAGLLLAIIILLIIARSA